MKYLADNDFDDLKGDELKEAIFKSIEKKDKNLKGKMVSEGTSLKQLTYFIGSDLSFGSGDKSTPIVLAQDYFWISLSLMSGLNNFIFLTNSLTLGV